MGERWGEKKGVGEEEEGGGEKEWKLKEGGTGREGGK